jgi:FSR family fosmidomycin resistance protein-like MFS transporter
VTTPAATEATAQQDHNSPASANAAPTTASSATGYDHVIVPILTAITVCHLLNDLVQSLIASIYPILKASFRLSFGQIGFISMTYQVIASMLQPFVGYFTDKKPKPFLLPIGMASTLVGLLFLATAPSYRMLLFAVAFVGVGSAVFHPESSRVARMASGGKQGFAQSLFQVGGNTGSAVGPLLAAFIVLPRGQGAVAWFSVAALAGIVVLLFVSRWYREHAAEKGKQLLRHDEAAPRLPARTVGISMTILIALIFSKYIYLASLTNYFTFYLISKFHVSVRTSQLHLFILLGAVAAGTFLGGPVGDRIGRKYVIWCSILGVLPFSLLLPYVNLFWTGILSVIIGFVLASAFSAILVYAQELVPGKVGLIAGLFFGLAFGMGGIGAALIGKLADVAGIRFAYVLCSYLPAIGLLTGFLPNLERRRGAVVKA